MRDTKFQKTSKERISRNFRQILNLWGICTIEISNDEENRGDNRNAQGFRSHCDDIDDVDEEEEEEWSKKVNLDVGKIEGRIVDI